MKEDTDKISHKDHTAICPFELALATHCAPVLLGKKPAALFPERSLPDTCPWELLHHQGFRTVRLYWRGQTPLIFVYHPDLLAASLANEATHSTLGGMGYPIQKSWRALLGCLYRRFRDSASFPQEVGFFLGYPPEDVLGFMQCPKGNKLCGVWKVYGDEDQAVMRFDEYARCRTALLTHIQNGGSILSESFSALLG